MKNPSLLTSFAQNLFLCCCCFLMSAASISAQCSPDLTPPTAVCPPNLTVGTDPGFCDASVVLPNPTASDNCPGALTFSQTPAGISFPVGTTAVLFTVSDAAGNTAACSTTVTVFDNKPPIIVCPADISVNVPIGTCEAALNLPAATVNDDCGSASFSTDAGATFPLGITLVTYTATDLSGNTTTCAMMVNVAGGIPLGVACNDQVTIVADADGSTTIVPEDMVEGGPYNCTDLLVSINGGAKLQEVEVLGTGSFLMSCHMPLPNGQLVTCWGTLNLVAPPTPTSTFHFPAFRQQTDTSTDTLAVASVGMESWAGNFNDVNLSDDCAGAVYKTLRQHMLIDWFSGNFTETSIAPRDMDGDGKVGDGFDAQIFGDSLYLLVNGVKGVAIAPKTGIFRYNQILRFPYPTPPVNFLGKVFEDINANCSLDGTEPSFAGWVVKAVGQPSGTVFTDTTDADGNYEIGICIADTAAAISLDLPYNYAGSCPLVYQIAAPAAGQTATQNIAVQLVQNCPQMSVDISSSKIRACFPAKYSVSYCNLSNEAVANAAVEVALDNYLALSTASIPALPLGGNTYKFEVGDLPAGQCGQFEINFLTDCNTPVGASHCSEASISPVAACDANGANWAGAWLEADARCDGDSVRLTIKNVGSAAMQQVHNFVVVEDLIMYMQATPFQLLPGEEVQLAAKADGSTFQIQSQQVAGHPFGGIVAAAIEGCGGLNLPGASLVLPVSTTNPFRSTDCQLTDVTTEPNYKIALPTGLGAQHLIEKNVDIEYTIHFQNMTTDTAGKVEVLVDLPNELDPTTVVPGAASHPFSFEILWGRQLRFRFDNINLPSASTDAVASQGFVSYLVSQQPDLLDGTKILSRAQVNFDSKAELTEIVSHQIGSNFISVDADEPSDLSNKLKIYPNPSLEEVNFELQEQVAAGRFLLSDAAGRLVFERDFSGNRFRFERGELASGVYFFQILSGDGRFSGRVILR